MDYLRGPICQKGLFGGTALFICGNELYNYKDTQNDHKET